MDANSTYYKKHHFKHFTQFALISLFFGFQANAQFTFQDDFKNNTAPDVVIGGIGGVNGTAYLTSGIDDPQGAGWLRLTKASTNQGGYAYVDQSFPSTLGIVMDFEYKMWRNVNDPTFNGADGIGVFLFDAADVQANGFRLGAYGGALGYTSNTDEGITYGLRGGYIGIGFDALGNYANTVFGPKNGGVGIRPNAVSLRGPTNDVDLTQSNVFLTGVTILSGHTIVPITTQGNWTDNELDYNTVVSSRPDDNAFYRRIQIEMQPEGGGYHITVRWKTALNSDFVQLIDYSTTLPPPALLSVGFAASTGAGVNLHEVRNLSLTTPGNLRITKEADKSFLRSYTTSGLNQITYYIDVINDTAAALSNVDFTDALTDGNGTQITPSMFSITNISHVGFLAGTNLPTTSAVNNFSGTLNIDANSTGRIIITGELTSGQIPAGNVVTNTVNVTSAAITDIDPGNNTAAVTVPVLESKVVSNPMVRQKVK
ncbi:lectin-like domain-containing protein [Flavobacterium mesophilum]|uniref:lectin-like domain-containing protein n=1 Tax=Flavobacterium mesophilum TaxID=3143495 RepID=UPI0031D1F020